MKLAANSNHEKQVCVKTSTTWSQRQKCGKLLPEISIRNDEMLVIQSCQMSTASWGCIINYAPRTATNKKSGQSSNYVLILHIRKCFTHKKVSMIFTITLEKLVKKKQKRKKSIKKADGEHDVNFVLSWLILKGTYFRKTGHTRGKSAVIYRQKFQIATMLAQLASVKRKEIIKKWNRHFNFAGHKKTTLKTKVSYS